MKESLTAHSIANEIRMTRSLHLGCFLLVEGKTADPRLYGRLIDPERCQIVSAPGKELVLGALEILENDGFAGAAAIVDADFWRLERSAPCSPNLFITDGHDLEAMILKSPAFEKLLLEFGSTNKLERFTQNRGKSPRELLLDLARPLGYLRWISQLKSLSLTFEGISFGRFIDRRTLTLDMTEMIRVVRQKSGRHNLAEGELRNALCDIEDRNNHDAWDVCCGHDVVSILSLALRTALGSNDARHVEPELLGKFLRTAYEPRYFLETEMYQSLVAWQTANQPFRILCAELNAGV